MGKRGGRRTGAGRKKNTPEGGFGKVDKNIATQVLALCERPIHVKDCRCELCAGWYWLQECPELRLRWEARRWYTEKRDGKNVQMLRHVGESNRDGKNLPVRIIVEHIGQKPQGPAPAQAK